NAPQARAAEEDEDDDDEDAEFGTEVHDGNGGIAVSPSVAAGLAEPEVETATLLAPPGVELFSQEEIEAALRIVQALDPAGIGARDLRECLLLQIDAAGKRDTITWRLVDEAFGDLIAHRWNDLGRRFGVSPRMA